jgi:hypothetical protein
MWRILPICLVLSITIFCAGVPLFAQQWIKSLEARLPSISVEGCSSQPNLFAPATTHTLSPESYAVRDLFNKAVPALVPKAIADSIISRQKNLGELYESMSPGKSLPKNGQKLLLDLSNEIQKFILANYQVPKGRLLTALLFFLTDHSGKHQWCLFYYVFVDQGTLTTSGTFSAEKMKDDKLMVTILSRDINRAKLSTAVVAGMNFLPGGRGYSCSSLSSDNLPPIGK